MSPRTGRQPKNGTSRRGCSLNLRLTEDEANAIQWIAEYFNLSRTDAIVKSIRYLQAEIEQNTYDLESYIEREREEFCETTTERLWERSEDDINEDLELFEEGEWDYFMTETLVLLEEQASDREENFDRDEAIAHFEAIELPELLEKEKKKVERRYEKDIENAVEEEWKTEEYQVRQRYFRIDE